jgi:hypothetical protein
MIRNRKELAKHWYPKGPGETDDPPVKTDDKPGYNWTRRALAAFERVITKHNAILDDPSVPDYIKKGWMQRLPKRVKPGCTVDEYRRARYAMTEAQADQYYREHANPSRGDSMPRDERGRAAKKRG